MAVLYYSNSRVEITCALISKKEKFMKKQANQCEARGFNQRALNHIPIDSKEVPLKFFQY
ncbi:hypothetical protein ACTXT7_009848 [Hymenolepis weldensis]